MEHPKQIVVCAYGGDPFVDVMQMQNAPPTKPEHHEKWFLSLSMFLGDMLDNCEVGSMVDRPFYTSAGPTRRVWLYGMIRLYVMPFASYVLVLSERHHDLSAEEAKKFAQDKYEAWQSTDAMGTFTSRVMFECSSLDVSIVRMTIDLDQVNEPPHNNV